MNELADEKGTVEKVIRELVSEVGYNKTKTILLLQRAQEEFGYLSREVISSIARHMNVPEIDVDGIATFYSQFRFRKPGKYVIKVCEGTACHVKRGGKIIEIIDKELNIGPGQATEDGKFSMERVACLGCCALAPVVVIDGEIHGMMNIFEFVKLLENIQIKEEDE